MGISPLTLVGALIAMAAFLVFFVVLVRSGGSNKAHQLRVIGEVTRGQHGQLRQGAMVLALMMLPVGACTAFAEVASQDAARKKACEARCKTDGFERGKIGRPRRRKRGGRARGESAR